MIIFLFALASTLKAQPDTLWSRLYFHEPGNEKCFSAVRAENGGFALFGRFGHGPGMDMLLIRTNDAGEELWFSSYGGEDAERGMEVVRLEAGFLLAGETDSYAEHSGDGWAVRVDEEGEIIWTNNYDSETIEIFRGAVAIPDDGFALAGTGGNGWNYWLVRIDDDGELIWENSYGEDGASDCFEIINTADGGFALAGHTTGMGPEGRNFMLVKTDADGEEEWSQVYGGDSSEFCYDVIQTADGGYAIVGGTQSFGAGGWDFYIVKTDEDGEEQWSRTYGSHRDNECRCIIQTRDGGFVLGGRSLGPHDDFYGQMLYVVRTDNEGEELWTMTLGRGDEVCTEIIPTPDGGYAFAGTSGDINRNGYEYWLIKTGMDILIWLTLPDTSFIENSSLVYNLGYFYDYISPAIEIDTLLVFEIEAGEHIFGEIEDNQLIITSEDDWHGLDSLMLIVAEAENEDNCDSTWLRITVHENNDISQFPNPQLLSHYDLYSAYPNPFNSSTTIRFDLHDDNHVKLTIHNLQGREVAVLHEGQETAGVHAVSWDASGLASGVYICRLQSNSKTATIKIVLMR